MTASILPQQVIDGLERVITHQAQDPYAAIAAALISLGQHLALLPNYVTVVGGVAGCVGGVTQPPFSNQLYPATGLDRTRY